MTNESQYSYIFFLGSHPVLSRREIHQVLTAHSLPAGRQVPFTFEEETDEYIIVTVPSLLDAALQDILGGSDRFGQHLGTFPAVPTATDIGALLRRSEKKLSVGLSGLDVDPSYLHRLGVELKAERSGKLRFVVPTGKAQRLNAAQVMAHRLDVEPNAELTIVRKTDGAWSVWRTVAVQDIGSYELRDTERPARDAAVGLLPPKLAQIMINFAVGGRTPLRSTSSAGQNPVRILDPFCGMGTILQEGWLADHHMVGSDSSERMVRATEKNLAWLAGHFKVDPALAPRVFAHGADTRWSKRWQGAFDAIVTEPLLGKPVKAPLPHGVLSQRMNELGQLYHTVFRASRGVLKEGGAVVFALPAWRSRRGEDEWQLFPEAFLDGLERLGYSRVHRGEAERAECIYARPDALVGRELTIWRKDNGP